MGLFRMLRLSPLFLALMAAGCLYDEQKAQTPYADGPLRAEAARNMPVRWKTPVGSAIVDDLAFQSDGRILVSLREKPHTPEKQTILLIDSATGREIWRYQPLGEAEYNRLLVLKDIVVYRAENTGAGKSSAKLVAIDANSGTVRWQSPELGGETRFTPSPQGGDMLVMNTNGAQATVAALSLSNGARRWERSFANPAGGAHSPVIDDDGILIFFNGIERLSALDGKTRWRRQDIRLSGSSPAARLDGDFIFAADISGAIHKLKRKSGKAAWAIRDPMGGVPATNIFPFGNRLYLRGHATGDASRNMVLVALEAQSGKSVWRFDSPAVITSNLLEANGALYYATSSGIGALDAASGRPRFFTSLTNSGRTYPVRIRRYGNNVVFIGELIIAAVDMTQGKTVYSHGFDPVNNEATLTAADARLVSLNKDPDNPLANGASVTQFALEESARYQEESNRYHELAAEYASDRNKGTISSEMAFMRAQGARNLANISAEFSRAVANLAVTSAGLEIATSVERATNKRFAEEEKQRQAYLRKSILLNYMALEAGEYIARPVLDFRSKYEQFVGVAVIHLPTGKIEQTNISAPHDVFGLWNLIDMENGIAYHNGVGLDAAKFEYTGELGFLGGTDYLKTFLIAQPIKMPR